MEQQLPGEMSAWDGENCLVHTSSGGNEQPPEEMKGKHFCLQILL